MSDAPLPANSRRIVTSHTKDGISNVQIDNPLIWNDMPRSAGKTATIYVTHDSLPTNDNNLTEDGATRELDVSNFYLTSKGPGANVTSTLLGPGEVTPLHRTSSQDYNVLALGELILIMDDGSETHLKTPGDVVILKGGLHAWKNPSTTQWAKWVTVLTSAEPVVVNGKPLPPAVQ